MELIDTAENMTLKGNYGLYYSEQETAMVTDSALMIQVDGADTMYVHADTLQLHAESGFMETEQNPEGLL